MQGDESCRHSVVKLNGGHSLMKLNGGHSVTKLHGVRAATCARVDHVWKYEACDRTNVAHQEDHGKVVGATQLHPLHVVAVRHHPVRVAVGQVELS